MIKHRTLIRQHFWQIILFSLSSTWCVSHRERSSEKNRRMKSKWVVLVDASKFSYVTHTGVLYKVLKWKLQPCFKKGFKKLNKERQTVRFIRSSCYGRFYNDSPQLCMHTAARTIIPQILSIKFLWLNVCIVIIPTFRPKQAI